MSFNTKLTEILLSDGVAENFTDKYRNDEEFKRAVDLLVPEVSACYKQEQRGDWHIYNVMEHILRSVEEINKLTRGYSEKERKMLAYVMFMHDLGKPEYHKEKVSNGRVTDGFTFHNLGSEKIAKRLLPSLDFDEKESAVIITLVREHDVFLKFSDEPKNDWQIQPTHEFFKNYIAELDKLGEGKRIFGYLILVGIADNKAQNPAMTAESLKKIAKIKEIALGN